MSEIRTPGSTLATAHRADSLSITPGILSLARRRSISSSTLTRSARRLLCASALSACRNALGSASEFNMSTIIVTVIVLWCVELQYLQNEGMAEQQNGRMAYW